MSGVRVNFSVSSDMARVAAPLPQLSVLQKQPPVIILYPPVVIGFLRIPPNFPLPVQHRKPHPSPSIDPSNAIHHRNSGTAEAIDAVLDSYTASLQGEIDEFAADLDRELTARVAAATPRASDSIGVSAAGGDAPPRSSTTAGTYDPIYFDSDEEMPAHPEEEMEAVTAQRSHLQLGGRVGGGDGVVGADAGAEGDRRRASKGGSYPLGRDRKTDDDLLYDPGIDEENERWLHQQATAHLSLGVHILRVKSPNYPL